MSSPTPEVQAAYDAAKSSLPAIDPTEVLDVTVRTRPVPEASKVHMRDLGGRFLDSFPSRAQQQGNNVRSSFWLPYMQQTQCSPWYRFCQTDAGPKYLLSEDNTYTQFTSVLDVRLRRKQQPEPTAVAAPAEAGAPDAAPAADESQINPEKFKSLKRRVRALEKAQDIEALQTALIESRDRIKILEKRLGALEQRCAAHAVKRPANQSRQAAKPAARQATTPKVLVGLADTVTVSD
jgi:hypothetical protein